MITSAQHREFDELRQCSSCPLNRFREQGKQVHGHGKTGGLVVIGESPGREEIRDKRPFVGKSGKLIRGTLTAIDVDPNEVYFTNVTLCNDGSTTPNAEAMRCCRPGLIAEVKAANPKAVLVLGASSLWSVLGRQKITKSSGLITPSEELGVNVAIAMHPSAILRGASSFSEFAQDVSRVKKLLDGTYSPPTPPKVRVVKKRWELLNAVHQLTSGPFKKRISLDIETTGLKAGVDRIVRIGVCGSAKEVFVFYPTVFNEPELKTMLEDNRIEWVGHNGTFDARFLETLGISWDPSFDTMLAFYCTDETSSPRLKRIASIYLDAPGYDQDLREVFDSGGTIEDLPDDEIDTYLAFDCLYTWMLVEPLREEMHSEGTDRVHDNILIPASHALRRVESAGFLIDRTYLELLKVQTMMKIKLAVDEIQRLTGAKTFNPNSPTQVAALLYDRMKISKDPNRSTSREALEPLQEEYPIVKLILDVRQSTRVLGTYIDGLLSRSTIDGRVHPSFLLHGTQTGRLSCRDPNLQNIPIVLGKEIRKAFIAPPGWSVIEADFSQAELRIAAWYSGDEALARAYREGRDIHRVIGSRIFNVPEDEITYEQRYITKYVDFGVLYGRGAKSLAEGELKCSVAEAQKFIDQMMGEFPGLQAWIAVQQKQVIERGYVETPLGRRRRFPLITDGTVGDIQRQSVNTPIQSLASDMCLMALTELVNETLDPTVARVVSTVHDSILLEARDDNLKSTVSLVGATMAAVPKRVLGDAVPFKASIAVGKSWGTAEEYTL